MQLLVESDGTDRTAIAWLAAIKKNAFLFEFASEVLRDKLQVRDDSLRPSDYETFLASKSIEHPEVLRIAESTRIKVRSVLLRMLAEVGILSKGAELGRLERPIISREAEIAIRSDNARWLAGFLVPDVEIAGA